MRYGSNEGTILAGMFETGNDVKIKILNMKYDTLVNIATDRCIESSKLPGVFLWDTSNIAQNFNNDYTTLMYMMYNSNGKTFYGKFVYGGTINNGSDYTSLLEEIKDNTEIINARI